MLRNWWEKTWRKWGQPSLLSKLKTRKVSRVCCDVTSHNLIPSRDIQSHLGTHSWQKHHNLKKYQQFHHNQGGWIGFQHHLAVCNYEKETNSFSFRNYCTLFSPSNFPNIQGSGDLTVPERHDRLILGPLKCRSNWIQVSVEFFWTALKSHSWRPTSKASALMRNACVRALAMAKDLLEHNDARLVVYGCSEKLYTGCTVLILAILKRTATAAIPVLSLRTTWVAANSALSRAWHAARCQPRARAVGLQGWPSPPQRNWEAGSGERCVWQTWGAQAGGPGSQLLLRRGPLQKLAWGWGVEPSGKWPGRWRSRWVGGWRSRWVGVGDCGDAIEEHRVLCRGAGEGGLDVG